MGEWIRYRIPNPCAPHMCVAFGHHVEWFGVCVVVFVVVVLLYDVVLDA